MAKSAAMAASACFATVQDIHEGAIISLKHLQEDVREVRTGFECGIGLKGFDDIQVGDRLECFIVEKVSVA